MHHQRVVVVIATLLAACGSRAAPRAAPGDTASACVPDGTWSVSWTTTPQAPAVMWGSGETIEVSIAPGSTEELVPSDGGPGRVGAQLVQVDRARCRIHVVQSNEVRYSDDAGQMNETLTLDLELAGDRATVTGTYVVLDTSEEPTVDASTSISGTATRAPPAPADE